MIKTTEENGGILGVDNTPTKAVASGIWGLNSVFDARNDGIWPVASLYDYPIEQSLRFDGTSYLSKNNFSASNRNIWTFSVWVKFARNGVKEDIFIAGSNATGQQSSQLSTETTDKFSLYDTISGGTADINAVSTGVYRDTSSWYHVVLETNTQSTYQKLWVNGTLDVTATTPSNHNTAINNSVSHTIGRFSVVAANYFSGYLANIQFIDGQALDPYFFGESKNGVWIPYNAFSTAGSGTATASDGDTATDSYGTNGFHLTFEDATSTTTLGYDYSGNNNHWTLN
jgi:hypothetical protein